MCMSKIYVSNSADKVLQDYLEKDGHAVMKISAKPGIDTSIACHPDIYMCQIGQKVFHGNAGLLLANYPGNAIYNGCSTGKFFIHNLKITSPDLLAMVEETNQIKVHVAQGYSKCNCVVVDEGSIITSDRGIEKAASAAGIDVLLINPGQVVLDGYKYGFLGGASGRVGRTMIFNGNLAAHSDYEAIKDFIERRSLDIVYFGQYPLTDIGSIIEEVKQ